MKLFKSRKTYYLYNPNTLNYERVYPSSKDRLFTVLRHLSTGIAFGVATFFVMMHLVDSPMESQLRKENRLLQTQYEVLSLRLNNALDVLDDIQQRDENLYRAQFWALLLRFPQLFWRNHYHAVAALIFRNLVLHELPPLFPALGTAAKMTGRFYLLGVKRFCHILPPSNLQSFSCAAWVCHLLCANLSFHLYRLPARLFMTSPAGRVPTG